MMSFVFPRYRCLRRPVEALDNVQRDALTCFRRKLAEGCYRFEEVPCLCGNRSGWLIARRDRYALAVDTHLCPLCGIMWTSPRMTEESLARFYAEDYRPIYCGSGIASEEFFAEQCRHGRNIMEFVGLHMGSFSGLTVFDVGCGAGGVLAPFAEVGAHVFGCDLGGDYLDCGRAVGLRLEQGGVAVLTKCGPANLVILSHVLEHLPEPRRQLSDISEILADGGCVYVELPGILNLRRVYRDLLLFLQNAHLYHFTLTTLTALMASAGFELVSGNENIAALYRKTGRPRAVPTRGEAARIRRCLFLTEIIRVLRLARMGKLLKRARAFAGRCFRGGRPSSRKEMCA